RLRDLSESAALRGVPSSWHAPAAVVVYVVLLSVINEIVGVPLGWYSGFVLERRYELSNETPGAWLVDRLKALGVAIVLAGLLATLVYGRTRASRERWWLIPGSVFAVLIVLLTNLAPVVLLPMFYSVK